MPAFRATRAARTARTTRAARTARPAIALAAALGLALGAHPAPAAAQATVPVPAGWARLGDVLPPRAPLDALLPSRLALAPDGTLVVGDAINGAIHRFDTTGRRLAAWGGWGGHREGTMERLYDVDVGSDGRVWVLERLPGDGTRVQRFGPDGRLEATWPGPRWALALAVAPAPFDHVVIGKCGANFIDGRVVDRGNGEFHHFDQQMRPLAQPTSPMAPLDCAFGLDIGADGSIGAVYERGGARYDADGKLRYVLTGYNTPYPLAQRAQRVGSDGLVERFARLIGSDAQAPNCDLVTALHEAALGADGRFYASSIVGCLHIFDATGRWTSGTPTDGPAHGLAVDPTRLWLGVDRPTDRVSERNLDGGAISAWGGARIEPAPDRLADVRRLTGAPDGTLYVLDGTRRLIRPFRDGDAGPTLVVPQPTRPLDVAVLPGGDIVLAGYVGGQTATTFDILDPAGVRPVRRVAALELRPELADVAADGADGFLVAVTDGRVLRVALDGTATPLFGLGTGVKDFKLDEIELAADGIILAAVRGDVHAVLVVDRSGTLQRGFGGEAAGDGVIPRLAKHRMAVLADGTAVVSVEGQAAVRAFAPDGRYVGDLPDLAAPLAMSDVADVAVARGHVWAIDGLVRLVSFGPAAETGWTIRTYGRPWLFGWPIGTERQAGVALDRRWDRVPAGANGVYARLDRTVHIRPSDAGPHLFDAAAGGGMRLWLDDRLLLDGWAAGPNSVARVLDLPAGDHTVRIEVWATQLPTATLRFDLRPFVVRSRLVFPTALNRLDGRAFGSPPAQPR